MKAYTTMRNTLRCFAPCFVLILLCGTAHAQSTWTGLGGNGNWGNAANWNPTGVPGLGSSVKFVGPANNVVDLGGIRKVMTLTFDSTISFSLLNNKLAINSGVTSTNSIFGEHKIFSDVSIGNPFNWNISDNAPLKVIGSISGAGGIVKQGAGELFLTGSNSFTGGTEFQEGIVSVEADANLGVTTGPLTFDGGDLRWDAQFDLDSNRTITLNAGGAGLRTRTFSTTISQAITGVGGLTKFGSGSLTLDGANTYSGDTTIENGTIVLGNAAAVQNSTVNINTNNGLDINGLNATLGALSGTGALDLGSNSLIVGGNDDSTAYSGVLSGTGVLTKVGNGTLVLTGNNTYSGGTHVNGGTLAATVDENLGDPNAPLTLDGGTLRFDAQFDPVTTRTVTLNPGGGTFHTGGFNINLNQSITGTGALTKVGNGTLTLTGNNTYSGGTIVDGGFLSITADENLGDPAGNLSLASNARLVITSSHESARNITLSGTTTNTVFDVKSGQTYTHTGVISGPGGFRSASSGVLVLAGDNTFAGNPDVSGGKVHVNHVNALGLGNGHLFFTNGELTVNVTTSTDRTISVGSGANIEVANTHTFTANGGFIGSGKVSKLGPGVFELTASTSYSPAFGSEFLIKAGTLLANNTTGSATGTAPVTVQAGGTLGGTGSIDGFVTVEAGGTVAPGVSIDVLNLGAVSFDSGSTFAVEVTNSGVAGVDFDQLTADTVTLSGGVLEIVLDPGYSPVLGDAFSIISTTSGVSGMFDNVLGAYLGGGLGLGITYGANDVTLEVINVLPGDFDIDDDVDGADLLVWQRENGTAQGLADWEANFGLSILPSVAAVPEPNAAVLTLVGFALSSCWRRR